MIHLVYAGQPNSGGLYAPLSITTNLYNFLIEKSEVKYWQWDSTDTINLGSDDIIIGHPNYGHDTIVRQAFRQPCRAKFLLFPLHTNRVNDNLPFDDLVSQADKVFSICGPYWYDSLAESRFAHWKPKITRLDMAIDPTTFPYVKRDFRQRRLLYIGSATPNKNLGYLVKIMRSMPDVVLHWYGGDGQHPLARLPNVRAHGWVDMNRMQADKIAADCSIMVSVSDSDANPTTLLETMAWGLIPACTKESGYYDDKLFTQLYLDDPPRTIAAIRGLLTAPEHELRARSVAGRNEILTKYTWDRFCTTIWDGIRDYVR